MPMKTERALTKGFAGSCHRRAWSFSGNADCFAPHRLLGLDREAAVAGLPPPERDFSLSQARPSHRHAMRTTPRLRSALPRCAGPVVLAPDVRALRACWPALRIVLAASSTLMSRRLAARESVEVSRWFYRQRIEAVLSRDASRPWFLLVERAEPMRLMLAIQPAGERKLNRSRSSCLSCEQMLLEFALPNRRANHSARCETSFCCGSRMDQEAARWAGSC